jgi:hypothetical protein
LDALNVKACAVGARFATVAEVVNDRLCRLGLPEFPPRRPIGLGEVGRIARGCHIAYLPSVAVG